MNYPCLNMYEMIFRYIHSTLLHTPDHPEALRLRGDLKGRKKEKLADIFTHFTTKDRSGDQSLRYPLRPYYSSYSTKPQ